MSRIGKNPIDIPAGVEVSVGASEIQVKGPKGSLTTPVHETVEYKVEDGKVYITRTNDSRNARGQHGLRRTLLANCVEGVSKGYTKGLEVIGVGYKVSVQGKKVVLNVGYSHPVEFDLPAGIDAKAEGIKLTIEGIDKQLVGEVAAQIRRVRPPEPYKGKGIKYAEEVIRRKAGKSGSK
ncbi:50S ribosomal subunit protein L6 [Pseudodesulfovibrio profundus]|uniref:Large ribosomal subunit protein uL6 n=1 Tax=Pseudodesulfovibrio profundus TaxID=57320 RepID=A0A2C8FDP2_9BACT|nr:50S ribosomal protein L6 [Pseudodesulfovibrio profundus]SOB60897.1 50S ribosomal subunit protein L6 [Pseudodesulfovibrio profundus]|tara:strand:+ start:36443 stop:36979 length:537 start_codon:yes stop_codon:yes gene_type:complete